MKCLHVDKEITSALQDAILGHIAAADPQPAEAIEVFLKLCVHEDTNYPQFEEATMSLEDLGFITLLGHHSASWLFRLTENGRLYVSELITDALCAMSATGKIAEA